MYIADTNNRRVRKVTVSTGIISTIAGTGEYDHSGDGGQATSASIGEIYSVAVDSSGRQPPLHTYLPSPFHLEFPIFIGNVYISHSTYHCIRKVTVSTGIIATVAGTIYSSGYSGDNGLANFAKLYEPSGIAVDSSGNAPALASTDLCSLSCSFRQSVHR